MHFKAFFYTKYIKIYFERNADSRYSPPMRYPEKQQVQQRV